MGLLGLTVGLACYPLHYLHSSSTELRQTRSIKAQYPERILKGLQRVKQNVKQTTHRTRKKLEPYLPTRARDLPSTPPIPTEKAETASVMRTPLRAMYGDELLGSVDMKVYQELWMQLYPSLNYLRAPQLQMVKDGLLLSAALFSHEGTLWINLRKVSLCHVASRLHTIQSHNTVVLHCRPYHRGVVVRVDRLASSG